MMDALDILKLVHMPDLQKTTSPTAAARPAAPASTNVFGGVKNTPAPKPALKNDLFQKSDQSETAPMSKGGRMVESAKKPLLEKPAPSGGLGRLFQTLRSNCLPPVAPASVSASTQATQEAAQKANLVAPAANPFKTMEAILLGKAENLAGLQNPALKTQSLEGAKPEMNKKPIAGLAGVALPLAGIGLLAAPVLGPAALVVKPGLLNPIVTQLPVLVP
jgi:hypothetical protein